MPPGGSSTWMLLAFPWFVETARDVRMIRERERGGGEQLVLEPLVLRTGFPYVTGNLGQFTITHYPERGPRYKREMHVPSFRLVPTTKSKGEAPDVTRRNIIDEEEMAAQNSPVGDFDAGSSFVPFRRARSSSALTLNA